MNSVYVTYTPYVAEEIASVLSIPNCDELSGNAIAQDMLDGIVRFTRDELRKLAQYKNVTEYDLIRLDARFSVYADPVMKEKRLIAANIIKRGFDTEFANDVCGIASEKRFC